MTRRATWREVYTPCALHTEGCEGERERSLPARPDSDDDGEKAIREVRVEVRRDKEEWR